MSKFRTIETKFLDRDALVESLADVGYTTVEIHDVPQHLYGYLGDRRAERANVIVRRQYVGSSSNDIGFVKTADGRYKAIISDFDESKHNTAWVRSLTKTYATRVALKTVRSLGFTLVKRTVGKKTVLEVTR